MTHLPKEIRILYISSIDYENMAIIANAVDAPIPQPLLPTTNRKKNVYISPAKLEVIKNMLASEASSASIAIALGVSIRTAQRWIAAISDEPNVCLEKRGPAKTISYPIRQEIETIIASDCSLTGRGIIERLPEDVKCAPSTLSRHIIRYKIYKKEV